MIASGKTITFSVNGQTGFWPQSVASLRSGVVIQTSSTLSNWCTRVMPRVPMPAAPASRRKQGVCAQYFLGSVSPSRISSACKLVRGTSAVGMSQRLVSIIGLIAALSPSPAEMGWPVR